MDSCITIRLATDMDKVREIMTDPHIWARAADDGVNKETFTPYCSGHSVWVEIVTDKVIGCILLNMENAITMQFHPYLLKGNEIYSREMLYSLFRWMIINTNEDINKINVSIPSFDRKLYNLAEKVGFTKEGVNRGSCRKNGEIFDYINFGITVNEMKEIVSERN